jgi:RNA polymerase sigma factor (sigma-70 family)
MTDSRQLLAEYVQSGSEAAFRELVIRYVDLVYAAALRLVEGDTHRAEDVAQTVFLDLARAGRTLAKEVMVGGWLHRHTCFVAANLMRGERRRRLRERQAAEMNANNSRDDFALVAPMLDAAIDELEEADRRAILLRFFEQHDFRSVGAALGSNEDAARMRVNRALEKLQVLLKGRGVTTSAAALALALPAQAIQAAPAGLALTISTAAAVASASLASTATATATKVIAMSTLGKSLVGATLVVAVGMGVYEARQAARLRAQVQTLEQQQVPWSEQVQQLTQEREGAKRQLAGLRKENEELNGNTAEVLRLRGEVSRLRQEATDQRALGNRPPGAATNAPSEEASAAATPDYVSKESMTFAGFAQPEATLKSFGWAAANGDLNTLLACLAPEWRAEFEERIRRTSEGQVAAKFQAEMNQVKGVRILRKEAVSEDEMVATVFVDGQNDLTKWTFKRFGSEWKMAGEKKIH